MDQISILILAFLLSGLLTLLFKFLNTKLGGNLYTQIRGGTPRAVGLAPFLVLLLFFPPPGNYLIAIIGIFAFIDDLVGRKKNKLMPFELGQLSRGIGMLLVISIGYFFFGPVSILIALMIQPFNIADMQPGVASSTVIIMAISTAILTYLTTGNPYLPILILVICLGYSPLDYKGKIMLGEVGNHSFGVAMGIIYAYLGQSISYYYDWEVSGTFIIVLILLLLTAALIAYLRRNNLVNYIKKNLNIVDPSFGDLIMDVLTGGGLGDLFRKIILGKKRIMVNNKFGKFLGLRRLFYVP